MHTIHRINWWQWILGAFICPIVAYDALRALWATRHLDRKSKEKN
jgi:hypothetical protein